MRTAQRMLTLKIHEINDNTDTDTRGFRIYSTTSSKDTEISLLGPGQTFPAISDKKESRKLYPIHNVSIEQTRLLHSERHDTLASSATQTSVCHSQKCTGCRFSKCRRPTKEVCSIGSMLRHRELGCGRSSGTASRTFDISWRLRSQMAERMRSWRSWTGASKDVVTAAWAPDGSTFALGASTDLDGLNIQYNRPNNLLLGDLVSNTITELPNHWVPRPKPELIDHGPNALEDTYNAVDPRLFTTVSHVCFQDSSTMYTSSFDRTIKIWDLEHKSGGHRVQTLPHSANVDVMTLSSKLSHCLASGQRTFEDSIRVYDLLSIARNGDSQPATPKTTFSSSRAQKHELYPTCLQWGTISMTSNLLLAGFAESKHDESCPDREGDLCLWDVETSKSFKLTPSVHNVFDVCWHPRLPLLAAATAPGSRRTLTDRYNTQSVVRVYGPLQGPGRMVEYECPALDINDVQFHPTNDNYISAGCTNGRTYIWDVRSPEQVLHTLSHGPAIETLDEARSAESQDTGVRFNAWDQAGKVLYTGSSDGVIKSWDIFRHPDDVLVRDIARFDSGIMTAAFSPDRTNLLVGLSKGAVDVLSSAPWTHPLENDDESSSDRAFGAYDTMRYIPAPAVDPTSFSDPGQENETNASVSAELISTGQLMIHPIYGAGKGPNYDGPWAFDLDEDETSRRRVYGSITSPSELTPDVRARQLDSGERKRGRRAGGKATGDDVRRYREADRVARERNVGFLDGIKRERRRVAEGKVAGS